MSRKLGLPDRPDSDELLRIIFASATDYAIFSLDPDGLTMSWNAGAERLLGYTETEMIGRSADVVFTPEDRAHGAADLERAAALAAGRAGHDRWHMRRDGSRFWASALLMPLANPLHGFVKILRDRTEWHRAEARHRQDEARFRLLATTIPQLVFRCQSDGARSWGSPQWTEFTGLDLGASVGYGWLNAIHPDDRDRTVGAWSEAGAAGEYHVEHRIRRAADGKYRWHQTHARAVDGRGEGVETDAPESDWVGTSTDVHRLHGLQDRQQVLLAELQHRTRNLLAVVQSIAAQTRRNSGTLEAFSAEFDGRLRALGRVQGLLARADHHDIDLRELVGAELKAHDDKATTNGKVRIVGKRVGLPAFSAQAIGLAVHELATNAVKHGALSQASGRLEVSWRDETEGGERRVVLVWQESGVSLPAERPRRKGYGWELIERALPYQLGARTQLVLGPDGLRCSIMVPLKDAAPEQANA
jgi:PAS domain S-box-containing protein